MKLIIDVPEKLVCEGFERPFTDREVDILLRAIGNGTSLPKRHGDLIDKEKLKENINGWYAFMKDICKQPYMTLKQEEIIGKIDMMAPVIRAESEE